MKQNGLWVIAFVIVALMVLTSVSPLSTNRIEEIDNSTYIIGNTPPDNPELGDLWFDTTLDEMNIYNGYVWQSLVPTVSGAGYQDHAAKHYWGGVDPISFHKLSPEIRVASEYATSGSGTTADPYINGIQEGIDEANSSRDNWWELAIIYLNGRFEINETIVIPTGIVLIGGGIKTATIELANGANCDVIKIIGREVIIRNIHIYGNKAEQSATSNGILINSTTQSGIIYLYDIVIDNAKGDGIKIIPSSGGLYYIYVERSVLRLNDGNGIHLCGTGTDGQVWMCRYINNRIDENGENGIYFEGHNVISGGIGLEGQFNRHRISGNDISFSKHHGIRISSTANIYIDDNQFYYSSYENLDTYNDIMIDDPESFAPFNIKISNNQFVHQPYVKKLIELCATADYIHIVDNNFLEMNYKTTKGITIAAGANIHGEIANNIGLDRYPLLKEYVYNTGSSTWGWVLIVPFDCIVKKAYMIASTYPAAGNTAFMRIIKVNTTGVTTDIVSAVTIAGLTNHSKKDFTLASTTLSKGDRIYLSPYGADIANLLQAIITIEMG